MSKKVDINVVTIVNDVIFDKADLKPSGIKLYKIISFIINLFFLTQTANGIQKKKEDHLPLL